MFFRKSKAAGNDNEVEAPSISERPHPTIISAGTVIHGNIDCEDDVFVDGRVRGYIRSASLTVSAEGTLEGEASAEVVMVQGHVKGPIRARHIHLQPGALVEGNLSCVTIAVDPGAQLSGTVRQEQPAQPHDDLFLPDNEAATFAPLQWDSRQGDVFRPLAAVRPRLGGR